ncbi:hypothetical protein V6R21_30625 [Limibacter armeniacum]|uniref:hypothetical protein n=1 Tax=Limibacter armeniacum TaxID=466084 RepID=UPI002FE6C496
MREILKDDVNKLKTYEQLVLKKNKLAADSFFLGLRIEKILEKREKKADLIRLLSYEVKTADAQLKDPALAKYELEISVKKYRHLNEIKSAEKFLKKHTNNFILELRLKKASMEAMLAHVEETCQILKELIDEEKAAAQQPTLEAKPQTKMDSTVDTNTNLSELTPYPSINTVHSDRIASLPTILRQNAAS